MLFVLNTSGVPAVAKIVSVPQYLPDVIVARRSCPRFFGLRAAAPIAGFSFKGGGE
jgi:hypothetical protein